MLRLGKVAFGGRNTSPGEESRDMRIDRRRFVGSMVALPAALAGAAPALSHHQVRQPAVLARQTADAIHGINPADMDFSVSPREDFYRYSAGGWLDRTTIPANRGRYSVTTQVHDHTIRRLIGLLDNLSTSDVLEEGSDEWKAVRYYQQGMDTEARNRVGMEPLQPYLDEIQRIDDLDSLHEVLRTSPIFLGDLLFPIYVMADLMDSKVNAVYIGGPSLGMPNRDFYVDESEDYDDARRAYVEVGAKLLSHTGYETTRAQESAEAAFALERELASATMTREQEQVFELAYNPMTVAELADLYPAFDWSSYLHNNELLGVDRVIVNDAGYFGALEGILRETPLEVLRSFLTLHTMWWYADYLSEEIGTDAFAFEVALTGVSEQTPLNERVLNEVGTYGLPDAVSKLYVSAFFPPEAKRRITEMAETVKAAFGRRLENNTWLTEATKERALEKLDRLEIMVGYPDMWKSYDDVEIGDSYAETAINAGLALRRQNLSFAGKLVDRWEWGLQPHEVNAQIDLINNTMCFPAAILQPPFFDHLADPAYNFGAFGGTIGHEITHAFDLMGSQFDADGNLADWWADEDRDAFDSLNQRVVEQYNAVEVLPGLHVNGQLTVGENVADLGGMQAAWDALRDHLAEHGHGVEDVLEGPISAVASGTPPVSTPVAQFATPVAMPQVMDEVPSDSAVQPVAQLNQAERFFIASAITWGENARDAALRTQLQEDEHAPMQVRAVWPLLNMDAFHETFGTRPGDAMYLAPEDRIVIW